jgi:alpha-beta hydrolase superfamily lysophospholipase
MHKKIISFGCRITLKKTSVFNPEISMIYYEAKNNSATTPSVLCIHGICHAGWCWKDIAEKLTEKGIDVFALNLRYHSDSSKTHWLRMNLVSVQGYLTDITRAYEHIQESKGTPPFIVGHSMGGFLTQIFANRHAVEIPGMALLASVPPSGALSTTWNLLIKQPLDVISGIAMLQIKHLFRTAQKSTDLFFSSMINPDEGQDFQSKLCEESFLVFLRMLFPATLHTNRFSADKTLVIQATEDRIIPHQSGFNDKVTTMDYALPHNLIIDLTPGKKLSEFEKMTDCLSGFVKGHSGIIDNTNVPCG